MFKAFVLSVLILCCLGLQKDNFEKEEFIIRIDQTFGYDNVNLIEKAISKWGDKLDVRFNFLVTSVDNDKESWRFDHIVTIYFAPDRWKRQTADDAVSSIPYYSVGRYLGVTIFPSRDIFIPTDKELYKVAMHEFGHVLNCPHSNKRYSIMFDYIHSGNMFIQKKDLKKVDLWFLRSEKIVHG